MLFTLQPAEHEADAIDDEVKLRSLLVRILELENCDVLQTDTAKAGLKILEREDVRVVLSDVKLPDANSFELVSKIKEIRPYTEVINLTAYGSISDSVSAIKNGAFEYLTNFPAAKRHCLRLQVT